jgi:hypothetical protein
MYGEHRRKSLREEDDFSPEQSYRLDTIQNKWQSDNFSTIPSIMPGTYSTEGLRLALQKQGGLNIVVEKQPHKYFAISQHENKWPDCLEMLRVVGGGHVHYVSESNTIFIDNDAGAFRPTMFEGTNIIVERRSPFVNGTITEMTNLPSLGRFMIPINFSGQSERFIGLTGVKDADLVGLNCSCTRNSDHEIEETFEEIRIDTLVGSPVRSKVIPFDTDVVLGKHQVICATKREHQSQWIVSIKIRILEPISHESPYDMSSDPIWEVARRNKYTFLKDDDTATYLMKPREGEPPWDAAITFTLQNEPKKVKVSYIPDVYMKTIRLP